MKPIAPRSQRKDISIVRRRRGSAARLKFLATPEMVRLVLDDPVSYVRRGGSAGLAHLAPDHPIWLRYAKAATPIARVTAKRAAAHLASRPNPPGAVLDIAAGHRILRDRAGEGVSRSGSDSRGLAERFGPCLRQRHGRVRKPTLPYDCRKRLRGGLGLDYDLVILANILRCCGAERCHKTILPKVKSSLSPRGRACAIEFVPDEDRVPRPCGLCLPF